MAYLYFFLPLATAIVLLLLYLIHNRNGGLPSNYPVVGMLIPILWNLNRFHEYITKLLLECSTNGTFLFQGPWFCNMRIVITTDPSDVHYVMSRNFHNFPKGPEFKRIFDVLGDGIFNSDGDLWKLQRQIAHSFFGQDKFRRFLITTVSKKIEEGLVPILDRVSQQGEVVDLQDLFTRLTLDSICFFLTGHDPGCLSARVEDVPFSKALDHVEEALFFRHAVPESVWKLFRWLKIGTERKMTEACSVLDRFIYDQLIHAKRRETKEGMIASRDPYKHASTGDDEGGGGTDTLTSYMGDIDLDKTDYQWSDAFLRDTILNLIIAGRDTTSVTLSWFFWLLSNNRGVESSIADEIKRIITPDVSNESLSSKFNVEDLNKMINLHAAICETLRLYPPVAVEHKAPLVQDTLPSGHKVDPSTKILFPMYAMGRNKSMWGDDCAEFKPERWISKQGKIKHEPSYKFLAFNAGPRTCVGKEIAFIQMKVVAASLIGRYRFLAVDGNDVVPDHMSILLHMKHGFKVRVYL